MGVLLESIIVEVLCSIILIAWFIYWYMTKNYHYWKTRGIPYKKPEFPFGSLKESIRMKTFIGKGHDNIYKEFPNERFYGIIDFRTPALVIRDPELIKKIMVKDFQHFVDRPVLLGNPNEYIMMHLLNLVGQEWKHMRANLTPTFTSGKMKLMFALMEKCAEQLKTKLEIEATNNNTIDVKNIFARFTLDVIVSCAFGLEPNSLSEDNAKFFQTLGGIAKTTKVRYFRRLFALAFPSVIKFFHINFVRPKVRDFLTNIVRDTVEYRKKTDIRRNDFLDLLLNIKHNNMDLEENKNSNSESTRDSKDGLTLEQMTAQTFVFFLAGFETASSLISFCLYELSNHQDIQEKLFEDIQEAVEKNEGKITYQLLMEIPLLDQVINETLRLYGSAHILSRVCTKSYQIPESDLVLEKGLKIIIPLFSLHHDPQYYPDPYSFNPGRFAPNETKKRHPYVFLPFGEGPRNCIGMRFGLMQAKVGLAMVILNFHMVLSPNQEVPIEIDKLSAVLTPANQVLLKFNKRKGN